MFIMCMIKNRENYYTVYILFYSFNLQFVPANRLSRIIRWLDKMKEEKCHVRHNERKYPAVSLP